MKDLRLAGSLVSLVLPVLLTSCGAGAVAAIASQDDSSSGGNAPPVASDLAISDSSDFSLPPVRSPAAIRFRLTDPDGDAADVRVYFKSDDTSLERSITRHPSSGPLVGLLPGDHVVLWDFDSDVSGQSFADGLMLRLEVDGGTSPAPLTDFALRSDLRFDPVELTRFVSEVSILREHQSGTYTAEELGVTLLSDVDG